MRLSLDIGYKDNVLYEDVVLELPIKGIVSFLGDNGSGKSTFHKTLLGKLKPVKGNLPDEIIGKCAVVSDYVHAPDEVKVKDVLRLVNNIELKIARNKYLQISKYVDSIADAEIKILSSGQKRIVEIYMALISGKTIILLDEASNALDYKNKYLLLDQVKKLAAENVLFIHTSHDLNDVAYLGGDVYGFFKATNAIKKYEGNNMSAKDLSEFLGYGESL